MTETIQVAAQITLLVLFVTMPVILVAATFALVRMAWQDFRK